MISALLSSTKPAPAADSPVNAFSIEITTGMSAPPTGMISRTPNSSARAQHQHEQALALRAGGQVDDQERRSRAAAPPLMNWLPGNTIGRPVISSCSFANAISEPEKLTAPITHASSVGSSVSSGISPGVGDQLVVLRQRDQRHRAAADAVEQRHHLRHRGHLHRARRDRRRSPCRSRCRRRSARSSRSRWSSSVATTAIAMPTAASDVAPARRARVAQAPDAEDEQHRRHEVAGVDEVGVAGGSWRGHRRSSTRGRRFGPACVRRGP